MKCYQVILPLSLVMAAVMPAQAASIGALVDGQVTAVHVKEGDQVTKGQPLLNIDSRALEAQIQHLQASVRLAELELKDANINYAAEKALFDQASTPKRRYDSFVLAKERASAQVALVRAQLSEAKAKLSYHHLVAPVDGQVEKLWVNLGDTVFHEHMKLIDISADKN